MTTETGQDVLAASLIRGDAAFRLQRKLGLIPGDGLGVARRAVFYALLTWLPIAVWAWWRGRVLGDALDEPLLHHFGVNVRCLIAIPLLVLAEGVAHAISMRLLPHFVDAGIVTDPATFKAVIDDGARVRDLTLPWVIIAGLTIAWAFMAPSTSRAHDLLWAGDPGTLSLGFGGWWYLYVARPVYVALVLAWFWRLLLTTRLMFKVSRLPLSLVPTHPDRLGGLGFLASIPGAFSLVILALSSVLAASWAHDVKYHQATLDSLKLPAGGFLILMLVIYLSPLFVFLPALTHVRKHARLEYAALVARHGRAVRERWIKGREVVDDEPLLQAPEIGPVADTLSLYDAVKRMRPVPVGRTSFLSVLVPAIVPMLVVVAMRVPIKDLLLTLFKALT